MLFITWKTNQTKKKQHTNQTNQTTKQPNNIIQTAGSLHLYFLADIYLLSPLLNKEIWFQAELLSLT